MGPQRHHRQHQLFLVEPGHSECDWRPQHVHSERDLQGHRCGRLRLHDRPRRGGPVLNQLVADVTGKPQTIDPRSFVAGGVVLSADIPVGDSFVQKISAKPQYLENTKDHSQIDSLSLIYTPFTGFDVSNGGFNLNDLRQLPFWPSAYGEVLFDLRSDLGQYTNRGDNPVQRLLNQNYARTGTHLGFSLTTDPSGPSLTLIVEETYLYGFAGTVRNLDLFHTQLTYNFDAKKVCRHHCKLFEGQK